MTQTKTRVGLLLQHILAIVGSIFQHTISGAEKDYNNLPEADKLALQNGAGIMTFISQEVGKGPDIIRQEILQEFPNLDEATLENGLYMIARDLNLSPNANNLNDTIAKLQYHFTSLKGTAWDAIVQAAAAIFSVFVAPPGSQLQAAFNLVQYVYLTFFKKKQK